MRNIIKSHIVIADRFLAALIYFQDKNGRSHLKISFKNKLTNTTVFSSNNFSNLPSEQSKNTPESIDVSYKFNDSLLEVKRQSGDEIRRQFHHISLPVKTSLFIIRVKEWRALDTVIEPKNPLFLYPNENNSSIAIIFSFLGADGLPIAPPEYGKPLMGVIDLPDPNVSQLCIGLAEDFGDFGQEDFSIMIPKIVN